ncbi:MAG: prepilin-type N-terminal cleavage/methylation domain-containing protein [Chthonomonas sp.]|nr:prepilin-type N-terminal cleavage/methylation domain-containing protein [Chthonomonas sp.]
MKRKAFTLIELLVVIAIIAILAAILFPVFAQAKLAAKKTQMITNAKQTGLSIILYTDSSDDSYPICVVPNLTAAVETYRPFDNTAQAPNGWFNYPGAQDEYALIWTNTTEPYRKNSGIVEMPGAKVVQISAAPWAAGYGAKLKTPWKTNLTMNGNLHTMSTSGVASVSRMPLAWQGFGDITQEGATMANPRLLCNGTGPCRFNPGGLPQGNATGTRGDVFTMSSRSQGGPRYAPFGGQNIYVFCDSSAKAISFGSGNKSSYPSSTNSLVPLQFLDSETYAESNFIRGRFAGSTSILYVAAFMPDNEFSN